MTQFTCKGVKQINNRISLNCISRRFSSAREFQMGNFQKYWSQNVDQDFIVLDFFHVWKIFVGEKSCGRKRCVREINVSRTGDQSMREIRLLRGRLPWKGGGLTGMLLNKPIVLNFKILPLLTRMQLATSVHWPCNFVLVFVIGYDLLRVQ